MGARRDQQILRHRCWAERSEGTRLKPLWLLVGKLSPMARWWSSFRSLSELWSFYEKIDTQAILSRWRKRDASVLDHDVPTEEEVAASCQLIAEPVFDRADERDDSAATTRTTGKLGTKNAAAACYSFGALKLRSANRQRK